jgi:lysophospholipase L1-like esterase
MRWEWILLGLGGALLLTAFRSREAAADSGMLLPSGLRYVVALGDSLTAHGGYCEVLEDNLPSGSRVKCQGYVGQGTRLIAEHAAAAVSGDPDDVIVLAGVNDLASGRSLSHVKTHLGFIYEIVKGTGARLVAVGLTPWTGHRKGGQLWSETDQLNRWIALHPLVDVYVNPGALGDSQGFLHPGYGGADGLHLSSEGQWALGQLIAEQAFG